MITPQLRQFYSNWLGKADAYDQDTLANHFDKFTSLYVVFNSLYLQVMTELVLAGEKLPKEYKDKKAATDYVAQYLKGKYFITQLLSDDFSLNNFTNICSIIENEEFHIILDYGIQQRALDLELLTYLRSNASQEKAKAILSLFYHVRCNLFHGQKGFEERQRQLLLPVNQLLRKTVVITFNKLDN
jgi:hypothetical protein